MKTNYLNLIRTKVKKPFKGGDIMKAANMANDFIKSDKGRELMGEAKDFIKSDKGKKLMGEAKDALLSKDKNAAMAKLQNVANDFAQSKDGEKLLGMAGQIKESNDGQKMLEMAKQFKESEDGKKMLGMAKGALGKTPQGAVALAAVDRALDSDKGQKLVGMAQDALGNKSRGAVGILESDQGQKNRKEDVATDKKDRILADDSEKSNKALLQLKRDFIKNNNKSVSYPEYLQVLPLDNHMKHKLSNDFSIHIDDIKKKIESARELINRQEKVNTDNQAILDKIREEYVDEQQATDSKWKEELSSNFKIALKGFGKAIIEFINIIFDTIRIIVSFFRSPIGWAIITIIVLCIVAYIILFMVLPLFGVNIIKEEKEKEEENNNGGDKVECSNKFKMDGIEENWNWGNFMKNPAGYSLNKGLSGITQKVKMPNALTNMYYNVFKPLGKGIENLSGNSIDKYKFNRPENSEQRTDSITNINYDLLSDNIQEKYSESFKDNNNSITLLKPKDIKWEFPHLDYRNTDYSKIPESIKKYKDETDKDAYSLNDTKNINFKWELFNDEYIISCNSKFDNNVDTNLFKENQDFCVSNTIDLNKYKNE